MSFQIEYPRRKQDLKFTPSGQQRMDEYLEKFSGILKHSIRDQRPIFTDKVVEVTAADVDRAFEGVKLISTRRLQTRRLMFDAYILFGFFAVFAGVFYTDIRVLFVDQPERLVLISLGITAAIMGFFARRMTQILSLNRGQSLGTAFFVSDFDDFEDEDQPSSELRNRIIHLSDSEIFSDAERHEQIKRIYRLRAKLKDKADSESK